MAGNIDPNFPHDRDGFWMNITCRLRASALHLDNITRSLSQNPFRNVTTAGIPGAKDKNGWFIAHNLRGRDQAGA